MNAVFDLRTIPLSSARFRSQAEALLGRHGLRLDPLDEMVGIYDCDDQLRGCGGYRNTTLKCIAIDEELQGNDLASRLVSELMNRIWAEKPGAHITLFTKPKNEALFASLGFGLIGRSSQAILMETPKAAFASWLAGLRKLPKADKVAAMVMNANPATRGHVHLIEQAAKAFDRVRVVLIDGDPEGPFTKEERMAALKEAVADLGNVDVVASGPYAISQATFPTYFLKKLTDASDVQMELDLNIFADSVAPALGATVRVVGEEPLDPLTAAYNETMLRVLPPKGIAVEVNPRLASEGKPISASRLRKAIAEGKASEALEIAAPASAPLVLAHAAAQALTSELELTPKPGLVTPDSKGAHTDMDADLMRRSIKIMRRAFSEIASLSRSAKMPDAAILGPLGMKWERQMLEATGGVNTHKGALFSLGLAVAAASWLTYNHKELTPGTIGTAIAEMAEGFMPAEGTHGAETRKRFSIRGALDYARGGYAELTTDWLPWLRSHREEPHVLQRLLLRIIAGLDDSNLYFRGGAEGAGFAREGARRLAEDFSEENLKAFGAQMTTRNLSPGGAADMLALTLFIDSITK